jgi:tetratricopeptide (TPR) repeat protein
MNDRGNAVFLSYASQDAEAAKRICEALRAAGIEVWFDQSELVGGDAWDQKIRKQIKDCALLMPIISQATQGRREAYFRLEWKLADERTHLMAKGTPFLLPVTIDETGDHAALVPDSFLAVQWTRLPGGETPPVFCARVKALLDGEQKSHAARPTAPPHGAIQSLPPKTRRAWLVPVVFGLVLVASVAWWQPWAGRAPSARPAPAAPTPAAELREKVKALIAKPNVVREDLGTATSLMEQVVRLEPATPATWVQWVWLDLLYVDLGFERGQSRLNAAREHLAQAVGLAPNDYEVRLARAAVLIHLDNGNPAMVAEAVPQLRDLLRERPDDGHTLILLSWCVRLDEKLQLLDRAARLPAFAAEANRIRFSALIWAWRFEEAEQIFAKIPPKSRSIESSVLDAAMLVFWQGDPEAARQVLDGLPASAMVEDIPGTAAFWLHFWRRDYDRALASSRRLTHDYIETNLAYGPKARLVGMALAYGGRTEAAQIEWRSALQLVDQRLAGSPNDQALLRQKIILLLYLGERVAAERLLRTFVELYPDGSAELEGFMALKTGDLDRAIDYLAVEVKNRRNWFKTAASLRLDPELDPLRSLPRFQALLAAAEADPNLSPKARAAAKKPATP